jgi:hypothetical protein
MARDPANATPEPSRVQAHDWRPAFLAAFRNSANVRAAAQAAGIDWSTAYKARKREPLFAEAWEMAEQEALDLIEARAVQLALAGDSHLLMFFLRTRRPEKYGDRSRLELTGAAGGPIVTAQVLAGIDDHEKAALRKLIDEALAEERS